MDPHTPRSTPRANKKVKAAGAFRVFLNFLQRPAKRNRYDLSLKNEDTPGCADRFNDARAVYKVMDAQNTRHNLKSSSFSGTSFAMKETFNAFSRPDVMTSKDNSMNELSHKFPVPEPGPVPDRSIQPVPDPQDDEDGDDEVFLEDSYFEDDYFEDFSGSSSKHENQHECDNGSYNFYTDTAQFINNLDKANPDFEKNYTKDFLELNRPVFNMNCVQYKSARRARHYSLPCDLERAATERYHDVITNIFPDCFDKGLQSKDILATTDQRSHSESKCDSLTLKNMCNLENVTTQNTVKSVDHFQNYDCMETFDKSESSASASPVLNVSKRLRFNCLDNESEQLKQTENQIKISDSKPERNGQNAFNSKLSSCDNDNLVSHEGIQQAGSPRNLKPTVRTSIESGYGSARRLSVPSPASESSTPMSRLQCGATTLSPHSLNALDGIPKPKRTPKRRLRPKFIFPAILDSPDFKSVPQLLGDSRVAVADQEDQENKFDDLEANLASTVIASDKAKIRYEKDVKTTIPLRDNVVRLEENQTSGIHINVNVSLNGVDLNNNNVLIPLNSHAQPASPRDSVHPVSSSYPSPCRISGDQASPSLTPLRRQEAQVGGIGITPYGKFLEPICTSSPLQHRISRPSPNKRSCLDGSLFEPSRITDTFSTMTEPPINRTKIFGSMSPSPGKTPRGAKTADLHTKRQTSTSERRKKLKRRSARTRLRFDELNGAEDDLDDDGGERAQRGHRPAGGYLILKRIAQSIIDMCPNRKLLDPWVDLPCLMGCINKEYSNLIDTFGIESIPKLTHLAAKLETSKESYEHLTTQNCIESFFVALLVRDYKLLISSLDYVFENISEIFQEHENLYRLAPEIVYLFLSNPRKIVKNRHGFPLPYSSSEKEVLKAVVKYVEESTFRSEILEDNTRVKSMLSAVADTVIIWHNDAGENTCPDPVPSPRPRKRHRILFHRFSPVTKKAKEYYVAPFISNSVTSLEDLASHTSTKDAAVPIHISSLCHDHFGLRKLYFSYGRYNGSPYITKIGMQYSCKGKKKTFFLVETPTVDVITQPVTTAQLPSSIVSASSGGRLEEPITYPNPDRGQGVNSGDSYPIKTSEPTLIKKTAIVLKAGEHVTGLSVLGQSAVHNVEIVTNKRRRIRAHGFDGPRDVEWVAIATPTQTSPVCLHAICGDVRRLPNRTYLKDLGAVWMAVSFHANDVLKKGR